MVEKYHHDMRNLGIIKKYENASWKFVEYDAVSGKLHFEKSIGKRKKKHLSIKLSETEQKMLEDVYLFDQLKNSKLSDLIWKQLNESLNKRDNNVNNGMKVYVVVSLFGGCFVDVEVFASKDKAIERYEKLVKEAGYKSVEVYEKLRRDGGISHDEPILLEEVEVK